MADPDVTRSSAGHLTAAHHPGVRGAVCWRPVPRQDSAKYAGSRLARTLSVPVRGFTHTARRAHGRM